MSLISLTSHLKVDNIYSWSRFTPLDEVKVVILGQVTFVSHDSMNSSHAIALRAFRIHIMMWGRLMVGVCKVSPVKVYNDTGLSFSVLAPTKPPASLKNIYKQLETDFPGFKASKTNGYASF